MGIFTSLATEYSSRRNVLRNHSATRSQKFFALLEIVCFPLSFAAIAALILQLALDLAGYGDRIPPVWTQYISPVLLAGAVGYLTNGLAIMMLFRPYDRKNWLFFWPQGMIPRNKAQIAAKLGDTVGNGLLSPEKIAAELSSQAVAFLKRPDVISSLKSQFRAFFAARQEDIIRFLVPQVQQTILNAVDEMLTPDRIRAFWNDVILPYLTDEQNCRRMAAIIIDFIRRNSSGLTDQIRDKLKAHLRKKIADIPVVGFFSDSISNWVIEFFADRDSMGALLAAWLGDREFQTMLESNVLKFGDRANEWVNSVQSEDQIGAFTERSKDGLRKMISAYLHQAFPQIVRSAIESEKLWAWFESKAMPHLAMMLSEFIAGHRDDIVAYLDLSGRIDTAVNDLDVREFHSMINSVTAEHLGAIQVLGFILGSFIGALQLLLSLLG